MSENSQELFEISKNLKSIAIIDFIPNDKLEEFDKNFSKFFGHGISVGEPRLLSSRPIEYSSAIHYLGKDKGIPEGLSNIQLIQVRHLAGVAQEIICNCEIDKEVFKELFDKFYEEYIRQSLYGELLAQVKREVDYAEVERNIKNAIKSIDLTEKYNFGKEFVFDFKELASILMKTTFTKAGAVIQIDYFNARLKFIENLQKSTEEFFQNLIPGIYLSKKENCLSAWIYDLSNSNIDVVRKAKEKSLSIKDVNKWKSKFEYRHNFGVGGEYNGTHLSLIGWTIIDETYESVSLLGQNFIFGYGMRYKDSYLGNYKTNYIILKLKKDTEFWTLGGLQTEDALTSLSKFLFPTEWIKHMYFLLLELDKGIRIPLDQRNPSILEYKNDLDKLSSELDIWIRSLDDMYKKIFNVSEISENLRYLESLTASNTSFLKEVKSEGCKPLSEYLLKDSKSWIIEIKKKIRDESEMQSFGIQYHNDTINTLNSLINIKYQGKLENLTNWLVGLTVVLVILTLFLAKPIFSEYYHYLLASGRVPLFP